MSSSNYTVSSRLSLVRTVPILSDQAKPGTFNNGDTMSTITDDPQPTDNSSASWTGWAELENDPIIFSTLLKEWGVTNVQVNEIVPLESVFNHSADSTFGLVFLSRWTPSETSNSLNEVPPGVWFANQTSSFSCASVAIMNIINNCLDLDLGQQLNDFHTRTSDMTPMERGIALDHFDHVRDIHNSFSTEFDRMVVDERLQQDVAAALKKAKAAAAKRPRKRRKEDAMDDEEEDNGFHFVAYVPAGGFVWRMDGMETLPRQVGVLSSDKDWIMMVLPELQATWESASSGNLEFSLLSLTTMTDSSDLGADEEQMTRMREDWGPFINHMLKLHAAKGDLQDLLA